MKTRSTALHAALMADDHKRHWVPIGGRGGRRRMSCAATARGHFGASRIRSRAVSIQNVRRTATNAGSG